MDFDDIGLAAYQETVMQWQRDAETHAKGFVSWRADTENAMIVGFVLYTGALTISVSVFIGRMEERIG